MFPFRKHLKKSPPAVKDAESSDSVSALPPSAPFAAIKWRNPDGDSTDLGRKPSLAKSIGAGSAFGLPLRNVSVSHDRRDDPMGLTVVYEPETSPSLDIIFVHGLGGTSRMTWAWERDPQYFWPEKWLPHEPGIQMARILSFGYNANWASTGATPITGIADFAKGLLFAMKFAKNADLEELELGQRPIIFIVHSMGGLVVKQAYLFGQNDEQFSGIVSAINAILFLATPHRGSNLAEVLNRILAVSVFNHSPKLYLSELTNGSQTVASLNEQFRHLAPNLDILSFYETLQTSIGPKKMMVVPKDSATLGYPKEISTALFADHHTVCKFDSTSDSNYISVRNALKTLVSSIRSAGQSLFGDQEKAQLDQLQTLLAVTEGHQDDLEFFRSRWTSGTCEWILSHPSFQGWLQDEEDGPTLLWLHALPASGKSILSSFVTKHLQEEFVCAYYFFRFGDESKRSLSACLRSIAFQISQQLPSFRRALKAMPSPSKTMEKTDSKTIWERIFVRILFKMRLSTTIHLVIDALDESDNPQLLVELLHGIASSLCRIKVVLVSRQTSNLITSFDRLSTMLSVAYLPLDDTRRDIRLYVETEIQYMRAAPEFKARLVDKLVAGAEGNFLWASLAMREVMECNTEEDVDETLQGIPGGMEKLYQRMERTIIANTRPRDRKLGQMILTWATCCRRPLALGELRQALDPEFSVMLDMKFLINRVCGQFVVVDAKTGRLVMVHQTASEHIVSTDSELGVDIPQGHEKLLTKCLTSLGEKHPQGREPVVEERDFFDYAMTSWAYHLDKVSLDPDVPLLLLARFFKDNHVLDWIVALAQKKRIRVLVSSAKSLNLYVRRKRGRYATTNPLVHRLQELELIELWATDLLKLVGKFGLHLTDCPSSIYQQIPPFCPRNSMIFRQFEQTVPRPHPLAITGLSRSNWDDGLAKISLHPANQGLMIVCGRDHFAVLTGGGVITLYSSTTFEVRHVLNHREEVVAMCFSRDANMLATYGYRTTKVWSVHSREVLHQLANPIASAALAMTFAMGDTQLVIGSRDRNLRVARLTDSVVGWSVLHRDLLTLDTAMDRRVHDIPWHMALSPDANRVAVAYRGFPLCVWSLETATLLGRCLRDARYVGNSWTVVDQMVWHPKGEEVLGLYHGGQVFRWNPVTNAQQELETEASIVACSPEGKFFTLGDSQGNIWLYSFQHFTLIYKLSFDHMITGICFSPDSKRLYDLRGPWCNVWEPSALLAGEESGEDSDLGSEAASIPTTTVSEASAEVRPQITATAIQAKGRYIAVGNDSGAVSLVDSADEDPLPTELWHTPLEQPIAHLDWSADGQSLACVETAGRVVIKGVRRGSDGEWTVTAVFEAKINVSFEGVQQVLLNSNGSIVLVKNGPGLILLPVDASSRAELETVTSLNAKWLKHPTDSHMLVAFTPSHVSMYRWDDLSQVAVIDLRPSNPSYSLEVATVVASGSHFLTHASSPDSDQHSTSFLQTSSILRSGPPSSISIPADLESQIEIPLGMLSRQRFVFLDKGYYLCSWSLTHGQEFHQRQVQQHYFLPKDWLNAECLGLAALLPNGALVIPNNGELAVVRSTALG